MNNIEQTLSIIKPDAVERNLQDQIKNEFKNNGFKILKEKKIHISKEEAEKFYKVHQSKPFYNDLCNYLSSGPIFVMMLQRENAVSENRKLMGATNPTDAEEGTLRKKYGISIDKNSVHGSDSKENAEKEILSIRDRLLGGEDFVLGSTDSGRAKWVESLANDMGVQAAFIYKKRLSATETKVTAVNAHVEGKHVIIYDDMIRTGGSLIGAAQAYMDAGARKLSVITTHGIFPEQAVERLKSSGLITQVSCTDSHPNAVEQAQIHPEFLTLLGIEDLLAKAIQHRT